LAYRRRVPSPAEAVPPAELRHRDEASRGSLGEEYPRPSRDRRPALHPGPRPRACRRPLARPPASSPCGRDQRPAPTPRARIQRPAQTQHSPRPQPSEAPPRPAGTRQGPSALGARAPQWPDARRKRRCRTWDSASSAPREGSVARPPGRARCSQGNGPETWPLGQSYQQLHGSVPRDRSPLRHFARDSGPREGEQIPFQSRGHPW